MKRALSAIRGSDRLFVSLAVSIIVMCAGTALAAMMLLAASSAAQASPSVKTYIEDVWDFAMPALIEHGADVSSAVTADGFYADGGRIFTADESMRPYARDVGDVEVCADADDVYFPSGEAFAVMRVDTMIPQAALPEEFQEYVEPEWDCESQAAWLDEHGYLLIMSRSEGGDLPLIGDKALGTAMTWTEARATGLVTRHFNAGVRVALLMTNEPGSQDPYIIGGGPMVYDGIAVTGKMLVVPDGIYDDSLESCVWFARAEAAADSGGCKTGVPAALALLLAIRRRRR